MKELEILNNAAFTKSEISKLLKINSVEQNKILSLKSKIIKDKLSIDFHQIEETIEISNNCDANCLFCSARNNNGSILRFRLNREEIINEALKLHKQGKRSIILHSGYDKFYNTDRIAYIIYSIKKEANIKITLSFGLREFSEYKAWKIAGADSYFLNFITSNKDLYEKTNSWGKFEERIAHISELKRLGYNVGSGSIIGLPGQTSEDFANDILLCKDLDLNFVDFCHYSDLNNDDPDRSVDDFLDRGMKVAQIVLPTTNVRLNNLIN